MTKTIMLYSQDLTEIGAHSDRTDLGIQSRILDCLNQKQLEFVKQYNWRADFNWFTGETELTIRKKQFTTAEWSRIFFLFPDAKLRTGPVK